MLNENQTIVYHNHAIGREEEIEQLLSQVIDPELGIDLINLGLIYEVSIDDAGMALVTMTLTTAGCPLVDYLVSDICYTMIKLEGVGDVDVNITMTPPWDFSKLSPFARMALGVPDDATT